MLSLKPGSFLIAEECGIPKDLIEGLILVGHQASGNHKHLILLRRQLSWTAPAYIQVAGSNYSWLEHVKKAVLLAKNSGRRTMLVSNDAEKGGQFLLLHSAT